MQLKSLPGIRTTNLWEIILQLGYQANEVPTLKLLRGIQTSTKHTRIIPATWFAPLVSTFQMENNSSSSVIKKVSISDKNNV